MELQVGEKVVKVQGENKEVAKDKKKKKTRWSIKKGINSNYVLLLLLLLPPLPPLVSWLLLPYS